MIPRRVLILDDDPLFLALCEDVMRNIGVDEVRCHETAGPALQALVAAAETAAPIDLFVCDLNMPGIDGVTVIRELGRARFRGDLLIISGEADGVIDAVRRMAAIAGVSVLGAMKKPISEKEVRDLLLAEQPREDRTDVAVFTQAMTLDAIRSGAIVPVFQPKVRVADNRVELEVLARLSDGERLVSAGPVIAAAEASGLITTFTVALLDRALAALAGGGRQLASLDFSINVSPKSLGDISLPDQLGEVLRKWGRPARSVTLEVTENLILLQSADVLEVLARLRIAGFALSIDDFGTGATSLEQLRLYPFTELKIDRSFVSAVETDMFAAASVETSIRLARLLGMRVVTEGVEDETCLARMLAMGADLIQGFLLSRPLTAGQLAAFMGSPRRSLAA